MALGGRGQGKASLESLGPESAAVRVHYVTLQTLYGLCFEEEEECLGPAGARYLSPKEREGGCVSCLLADLLTCAGLTQKGLCLHE